VKLTNTMVVHNDKKFLPADPMYMSGPPLHVLATALLDELLNTMPGSFKVAGHDGPIQVSFSAGVTKENVGETIAMGVTPATLSSDLLRPGGYGRLEPILRQLERDLLGGGVNTLDQWHHLQWDEARAAGFRGPAEAHLRATLAGDARARYDIAANEGVPRAVDHDLQMWDCVACNLCVTVCPNDAFFRLPTLEGSGLSSRQQYIVLAELCNECGNCMVFCPENGDPAKVKAKLFIDPDRFATASGQGFLVTAGSDGVTVTPRPGAESDVPRLNSLLNDAEQGVPLRLVDIAAAAQRR